MRDAGTIDGLRTALTMAMYYYMECSGWCY